MLKKNGILLNKTKSTINIEITGVNCLPQTRKLGVFDLKKKIHSQTKSKQGPWIFAKLTIRDFCYLKLYGLCTLLITVISLG